MFWCSHSRRAWAFRSHSASACGRSFLARRRLDYRVRRSDRLNRLCFAGALSSLRSLASVMRAHDRPIVRPPLLRFAFPSASTGRAALSRGGQPRDHPASTLRLPIRAFRPRARNSKWISTPSLRFFRLVCLVRPAHAARLIVTLHTGPVQVIRHGLSFARRSATRSTEPFHDLAVSFFSINPATLMGFLVPFAVFPGRGSPHLCSSSPLAVIRLARTSRPADFYEPCRSRLSELLPQVNEFQMRPTDRANDPTGFWVLLPRTSQATPPPFIFYERARRERPILPWACWLLSGLLDAFSQHAC